MVNRLIIATLIFFTPVFQLQAQVLFVQTVPMGAAVWVDGVLQKGKSPLLLRGLSLGSHGVKAALNGYGDLEKTVILEKDKPQELTLPLVRSYGVLAFPDAFAPGSAKVDPSRLTFLFPQGTYQLKVQGGQTLLETPQTTPRTSPLPGVILALTLGAAGSSTYWDIAHPPQGSEIPLSGATLGTYALSLAALFWTLSESKSPPPPPALEIYQEPRGLSPGDIQTQIQKADQALSAGKLSQAEELFLSILETDPQSPSTPMVLYRLARVHAVQGRGDLASVEFKLLIETYPQREFYDRWVKALSDLEKARGQKKKAADLLDLLIYYDPLFTPAAADQWKKNLRGEVK